jgi:hypothetical protein
MCSASVSPISSFHFVSSSSRCSRSPPAATSRCCRSPGLFAFAPLFASKSLLLGFVLVLVMCLDEGIEFIESVFSGTGSCYHSMFFGSLDRVLDSRKTRS